MKTAIKILIVITLCFSFARMVKADSAPPSKQTTFYFQKNGQPITQPVKFTIKCYGTSAMGGDNKLLKISEFSETCQAYGCKFNTSNIFEVYRQNIIYCDLEEEANGEKFTVKNFLSDNLSELICHRADFTISTGNKYYKRTAKYEDCRKDVYKEYYPQGNGEVKGDFLCAQYKTDEKLIPTTISTEPNGHCYHSGYTIKNNICYEIPQAFYDCTAGEDGKMKLCDQYLEDVTSKLAKDKNGYPFEEICEAKINVPANISNNQPTQDQNIEPTPQTEQSHPKINTVNISNNQPMPSAEHPQSKSIFIRIIDFFRCSFLKLFGKSC